MAAAAKRKRPVTHRRRQLYAKVHIALKDLGIDDDTYRDLLENLYGVRSGTRLSDSQLVELIEYFEAQGFKPSKRPPRRAGTSRLADGRTQRKARALWLSLYHLGVVRNPSETDLMDFCRRVTGGKDRGIARLEWLDEDAAYKLIEALKAWAARDGDVSWDSYPAPDGGRVFIPRRRVVEALIRRARPHLSPAEMHACLAPIGGAYTAGGTYEAADLDAAAVALGKVIRAAGPEGVCRGG